MLYCWKQSLFLIKPWKLAKKPWETLRIALNFASLELWQPCNHQWSDWTQTHLRSNAVRPNSVEKHSIELHNICDRCYKGILCHPPDPGKVFSLVIELCPLMHDNLIFCCRRNCILADEMGLGKTIQSITFLQKIFDYGLEVSWLSSIKVGFINWN